MKIVSVLTFCLMFTHAYGQNNEIVTGIDDYIDTTVTDSVSEYSEQLDDEFHTFKISFVNSTVFKIEGTGSGEFRAFEYGFYFRNDTLIYSVYFNKVLKGHWSEFDDRDYEYHEREECIYYMNDKPILIKGYDSESENQSQNEDSDDEGIENNESPGVTENQLYCVDFAYELLEKFRQNQPGRGLQINN